MAACRMNANTTATPMITGQLRSASTIQLLNSMAA